jgi:hypothetical protein
MACVHAKGLRRTELQIEPILPEGYEVMKAVRMAIAVVEDAYDLQRDLQNRYPKMRW